MYFRQALAPYVKDVSPRYLGKLHNYVDTLRTRQSLLTDRYVRSYGNESQGVRLLRKILSLVDIDKLLTYRNDHDRYIRYLQYMEDDLRRSFDPANGYNVPKDSFYTTHKSRIIEVVVPTQRIDYLVDLPLNKPWSAWKDVRPVRVLSNDSSELTFHAYTNRLVFQKDPPRYVIIGIDPVALILQYIHYLLEDKDVTPITETSYLSKYVVIPALMEDTATLWLRNVYTTLLKHVDTVKDISDIKDIQSVWNGQLYGYLGSQFDASMREVGYLVEDARRNAVKSDVLLNSLQGLTTDMMSIYRTYDRTCIIESGRQYYWLQFLKELEWLEMTLYAVKANIGMPHSRQFLMIMKRDLSLLGLSRFWTNCRYPTIRTYIEERFRDLTLTVGVFLDM